MSQGYDATRISVLMVKGWRSRLEVLMEKPVSQWVQEDWVSAVFTADEGGVAKHRLLAKLKEAYPEAPNLRSVLEFAQHAPGVNIV